MRRRSENIIPLRRRQRKPASQRHRPPVSFLAQARSVSGFLALAVLGIFFIWTFSGSGGQFSTGEGSSPLIVGTALIVDGDTIRIGGTRIRLHGIDAPESEQTCRDGDGNEYRCGQRATSALSNKIGGKTVTCERKDTDRYGRIVAVCRAGGEDLNGWLVSEGHAVAYMRYSFSYVPEEIEARFAGRGIWAGTFTDPEDWRHRRR